MESSQPSTVDSVSPPTDIIESIREMYEKIDPAEQIDLFISFIENQLHKMNTKTPSEEEAGSSSSKGWLETVPYGTELAGMTINTISKAAERPSKLDPVKAMERLTFKVIKGMGKLHLVLIGLSTASFALDRYMSVGSKKNECKHLLLKILELARDVKQNCDQMSDDREMLYIAVGTIVEGAVFCCDSLENYFRFWSTAAAAAQLDKTYQLLRKDYGVGKDVFLSHSGKEKNFVRQLHRDLTREHVSCFFDEDQNSLPLAEKFPPLIFKAAETCKIALVVLSKEFLRSKWPLLELSAFLSAIKSRKNPKLKILPVFFMITPKELSHITKDSPEWKELVESSDTRNKWQDAIKEVRAINGLQLGEDGNEVDCRDRVVKEICCFLKGIKPPKLLYFEPVGIEEQVQEVKALLEMEGGQSALAVIICGFGGVGKTILADSVVQSLDWSSTDFKFCRVAIDEKTPDKTSHILRLQENILDYLGGVKTYLQDPDDGGRKITEALSKKSSLLYIDNVVDKEYIKYLLPNLMPVEQEMKLRIIITSREKMVKAEFQKPIIYKEYEVKGLCDVASKSLLSKTILENQVLNNHEEERMINEVAAACRGVPLLLSVFGKHLRIERDNNSYEEAMEILKEGDLDYYRDENLGTRLMFVYDKIKNVEVKEAFLDICTYFHGWEWNLVADIVDFPILDELHRRTLVSKSSGRVIVHDVLRLMGMKKARLTRFSNYEELSDALEDNVDVKGISLINDNSLITIKPTLLKAFHQSLRVLMLGDWVTLDGPPCHRAFRNLRYLCVGDITTFPFKDPSKLDKLRVLVNRSKPGMNLSNLPSSLKRISQEVPYVECNEFAKLPFQNLRSLKSFIVHSWNSVELPQELHLPVSLVHLALRKCKNLPKDIGHLTALESLILDRSDLTFLPEGFGKLERLRILDIFDCSQLKILPHDFEKMATLEKVRIRKCPELDGAMMKKLVELQNYVIDGEEMPSQREHQIAVSNAVYLADQENRRARGIRVALLNVECLKVNNTTHQLMERSSFLLGLEKGKRATVALILLPIQMQSHQHQILQRFVKLARRIAKTNTWGKLNIVCARKNVWSDQRRTPTEEEERAEEEGIRQILLSLPKESCAIPSSESKHVKLITCCCDPHACFNDMLSFFVANVVVDIEGRNSFQKFEFYNENQKISKERNLRHIMGSSSERKNEHDNSIQNSWDIMRPSFKTWKLENNSIHNFIKSIMHEDWDVCQTDGRSQSQCIGGESKSREFIKALKGNGIDHLLIEGQQVCHTFPITRNVFYSLNIKMVVLF